MSVAMVLTQTAGVALPTEGVDRNDAQFWGVPQRRKVALPTEGVDRNSLNDVLRAANQVALPTEGVDRNPIIIDPNPVPDVALPTEGVDRNTEQSGTGDPSPASPSPRRAWIEI